MHVPEPPGQALGRSPGGFGTQRPRVGDGPGRVLAVGATPGPRHQSPAVAVVRRRAKRPRRAGQRRWPRRVAGDKGSSDDGTRAWLRRQHRGAVIPTRKDQPRDEALDKEASRRRSRVEPVIGWYKGCRALGTRYDKLAVDYVALWMIASIEKLLRKYWKRLEPGLSERA